MHWSFLAPRGANWSLVAPLGASAGVLRTLLSTLSLVGLSGCAAAIGGLLIGTGVAAGRLSMQARLTQSQLVQGHPGHVSLVVGIDALELQGPRPPINAAIVLDRSGSMSGDKIRHAKEAAKAFVRGMRDGDRVALVTYSSNVEVLLPSAPIQEESQMRALALIEAIEVAGMTNLSGGLLAGRDQVLASSGDGRVNRVVLISDGVANVGITDASGLARLAEDLREHSVSLTAMGVGLDFNEDVMMRLADRGGGNYYYVRDAHRLAGVFRKELQSLAGVVAQRPEVVVRLATGVRVRDVPGYTFEQRGDALHVKLADIAGGAKRKVVVHLDVPTTTIGQRSVADVQLAFSAPRGNQLHALRASVVASVTRDQRVAQRSVDVDALKAATRAEAGVAMTEAVRLYEKGDAYGAARVLEARRATLQKQKKAYDFQDDATEGELSRAARTLRASPAAPAAAAGVDFRKDLKSSARELAR